LSGISASSLYLILAAERTAVDWRKTSPSGDPYSAFAVSYFGISQTTLSPATLSGISASSLYLILAAERTAVDWRKTSPSGDPTSPPALATTQVQPHHLHRCLARFGPRLDSEPPRFRAPSVQFPITTDQPDDPARVTCPSKSLG